VSVNPTLPYTQQQEVAPIVRREVTTTLWGPNDPGRAKGFTATLR
jgi:hypothetical protein